MTAPSSPVPAVEAELSNEDLLENFRTIVLMHHAAGTRPKRYVDAARAAVLARMSTPTPGRAAEPDTMVEVERLVENLLSFIRLGYPERNRAMALGRAALVDYARTIVTGRDDAENRYDDVWAQLINEQQNSGRLRTRAETAEAQLATREWQDISTAPKDGTKILVFGNMRAFLADRVFIASWDRDIAGGAWMGPQARCIPRCWQPLPEPPLSTSGADR
jgi:hypothetical protein